MAGTQALRQVMGHGQFGARVVYGDCLFATVSPNEQHSALVLRLSRYRQNDPTVKHGGRDKQKAAESEYPMLEAQKQKVAAPVPPKANDKTVGANTDEISIDSFLNTIFVERTLLRILWLLSKAIR